MRDIGAAKGKRKAKRKAKLLHTLTGHPTRFRAGRNTTGSAGRRHVAPFRAGWISMLLLKWLRKWCNHPAQGLTTWRCRSEGCSSSPPSHSRSRRARLRPRIRSWRCTSSPEKTHDLP